MSQTFLGALVRERGVKFAIVAVQRSAITFHSRADATIAAFEPLFGVPVVLVAQDGAGRATWYGRGDIARYMSRVPLAAVRWRRYTIR